MSWRLTAIRAGFAVALLAFCAGAGASWRWRLPSGVAPPPGTVSAAKVELGRQLFYDADLSADGTMSCGTCHEQKRAFTEGNASHPGVKGDAGRRNVMSLTNVGYFSSLTWGDPGVRSLEAQAMIPIEGEHPIEMGMSGRFADIPQRLGQDACYRQMFKAAFPEAGGAINERNVGEALAAFERTLVSFGSPYDRYGRGERTALSPDARRGLALFTSDRMGCSACHAPPLFTDAGRAGQAAFHDIGLYEHSAYPASDRGLSEITHRPEDVGRFRTPGLRNVALTGPYMHDGSVRTLPEAIRRHRLAGVQAASDGDISDLVAFLQGLTDPGFVSDPALALPRSRCGRPR